MKWISVKNRLPKSNQLVKIKADYAPDEYFEGEAIFTLYDIDAYNEAWGWTIKKDYNCTLKPTHWIPLHKEPDELD